MIVTITLTPALDKTVTLPGFAVDKVNRVQSMRLDAGGKGINVSKVLKALGTDSVACGILGGGTGRFIQNSLTEAGIACDFAQVPQDTRTNLKVIDPVNHTNTDINEAGAPVSEETLEEVFARAAAHLHKDDIVVLAGKAPQGTADTIFADWTKRFRELGVKVYMDADAALLIAGVIVHDLAKIDEMDADTLGLVSDYSVDGKLIGHIVRGVVNIQLAAEKTKASPGKALLLQHMVLSHHGIPEYGSPLAPKFPEAEAVLITSCIVEGQHAVVGFNHLTEEYFLLPYEEIPVQFPGTGDIFSSIIVGRLKDGDHLRHATRIAMDTLRNWIDINKDDKDKNRGIPIERHLGDL